MVKHLSVLAHFLLCLVLADLPAALQMSDNSTFDMPEVPSDTKYIVLEHKNECFDWGTFGWAIETQQLEITRYKHIIFLNGSVRGQCSAPLTPLRSVRAGSVSLVPLRPQHLQC